MVGFTSSATSCTSPPTSPSYDDHHHSAWTNTMLLNLDNLHVISHHLSSSASVVMSDLENCITIEQLVNSCEHTGAIRESAVIDAAKHVLAGLGYLHKCGVTECHLDVSNVAFDTTTETFKILLQLFPQPLQAKCATHVWNIGLLVVQMLAGRCFTPQELVQHSCVPPKPPARISLAAYTFVLACFEADTTILDLSAHPFLSLPAASLNDFTDSNMMIEALDDMLLIDDELRDTHICPRRPASIPALAAKGLFSSLSQTARDMEQGLSDGVDEQMGCFEPSEGGDEDKREDEGWEDPQSPYSDANTKRGWSTCSERGQESCGHPCKRARILNNTWSNLPHQ